MAYLKNWTDNFFQMFFMGTSWVAVSIKNIKTRASTEMTSRKNIKIFDFNGVNVTKNWHVAGEVFAISDCLVAFSFNKYGPGLGVAFAPSLVSIAHICLSVCGRNPGWRESYAPPFTHVHDINRNLGKMNVINGVLVIGYIR